MADRKGVPDHARLLPLALVLVALARPVLVLFLVLALSDPAGLVAVEEAYLPLIRYHLAHRLCLRPRPLLRPLPCSRLRAHPLVRPDV